MQLKQLRLLGFKTFADKTEIEIDQGMTAVVGPNGSGKSNIADALLWVLGEQNPRFLRGASSQDVIFSGSDKRKPLGMAEVRLTVDNADGALPIDFSEVVLTRRVYRSGESQYLLNNAPCRLKDIVELFLDTGMGKGAYSFVSQSEIDAVLSARAEDRRELFEEAAGIKKYRVKKRDALRKLENAQVNLTRVYDILRELEVQREPMERQALAARRFLMLTERLHAIEVGLLVAELQKADYEIYACRQEREEDQSALLEIDGQIVQLDQLSVEINTQLTVSEAELEQARAAQQNARSEVERLGSRLALVTERSAGAGKNRDQLDIDIKDIERRIGGLADSIEIDRADREIVDADETARRDEWAGQIASLSELDRAVADAMSLAEERQSERTRIIQERASRESALKSAIDRMEETAQRANRVEIEAKLLAESLSEGRVRESEAQTGRESLQQRVDHLAICGTEALTKIQNYRTELSGIRIALDTARRQQAEDSARLNTLTELQQSHEGFYQGVKAVLNAHRRNEIEGHYVTVVDILAVPEKYRVAIEVALGGSLQDIVTLTEGEAKAGIQWLKQNRAGRATFLPIPLLRPAPGTEISSRHFSDSEVKNAADIVGVAQEYEVVAQLLLGRVLVVDNMDTAISVSRRMNGWSKIVTLEGELLTPGGALTGGSLQGRGAHLVGRKGEMDDLRRSLPAIRKEAERLTGATESITTTLREAEEERNAQANEHAGAQAQLIAMETARASAEREMSRIQRDLEERQRQGEQLREQALGLQAEADRLSKLIEEGNKRNDLADTALSTLSDETRSLIEKRDACRAGSVALEVEVGRLKEKREGLTRAIAADRASLGTLERQLQQRIQQRDATAAEGIEAAAERESIVSRLEQETAHRTLVDLEFEKCRKMRQTQVDELAGIGSKSKEAYQQRDHLTKSLHEAELRLAKLEMQISQATERLHEEYGITREEALARPEDVTIDKNTAMEVGRLRRELRAMGQVNTGAAAEFDRLTERYAFLTAQKDDLESGRESLLQTIAEIDDSTRGVFMETFDAVKAEFQSIFCRLFEGGTTKLVLTDPNDLLETGIEVIAQPPGKKPQHLSLLSGGERALTATALLFAFLAVRPSPFVILDEVDAPLDGANVEKFTALVRDFSQRSQFLIITHNPVTMEAAPTWYGVTMREAGVSSILSYRVPQESTVSEPDEAVVISA